MALDQHNPGLDPRDIAEIYAFQQRSACELALQLLTTDDPAERKAVDLFVAELERASTEKETGEERRKFLPWLQRVFGIRN